MKSIEDKSRGKRFKMASPRMALVALGLTGVAIIAEGRTDSIRTDRQETCQALSSTLEEMRPDESTTRRLCTNKMIKNCLVTTNFCPKE